MTRSRRRATFGKGKARNRGNWHCTHPPVGSNRTITECLSILLAVSIPLVHAQVKQKMCRVLPTGAWLAFVTDQDFNLRLQALHPGSREREQGW